MINLSKTSPVLSGILSLWGLTVLTYLIKTIPMRIWKFIKTQFTTTLEFDNAQGWAHKEIFYACLDWFHENKGNLKMSRVYSLYTNDKWNNVTEKNELNTILAPGYGLHIFLYQRKLLFMELASLESSGSELQKRQIKITCIGRSKKPLESFVENFIPEEKDNRIFIYRLDSHGSWLKQTTVRKRSLKSIAIDQSLLDSILLEIKYFHDNEEWFMQKGLPYKLTYILHGIPGTGKTSLIKAISSHYNKNLCILNTNYCTDDGLQNALSTVPVNSIVVMEDFDSEVATNERVLPQKKITEDKVDNGAPALEANTVNYNPVFNMSALTLSGILNGLDGIQSLHDVVIFLTTNHLEIVDQALYREGRVDRIIELKKVPAEAVKRYVHYIFPEYDISNVQFNDILGCKLNSALLSCKKDAKVFINKILGIDKKE